jgi:hypothetical protein
MVSIISHDAGGAEILSSWLRHNSQPHCLVLDGPAVSIFQKKLGNSISIPLEQAVEISDWVLCGTSWQSNLEKRAITQAKIAGKKVVAFLDHWVNYRERFQFEGITILPDEIWVGDINAELIAQQFFPDINIILIPNPYFIDLQADLERLEPNLSHSNQRAVLYVCEPIREHSLLTYGNERYWGYVEEEALQFFLDNVAALGGSIDSIKIRLHPSETTGKYDWAKGTNSLVAETITNKSLLEQIVEADIVVGCGSMAMVVALLAKKRVISAIPPGGKACELPQDQIEHLQVLVKKNGRTPIDH